MLTTLAVNVAAIYLGLLSMFGMRAVPKSFWESAVGRRDSPACIKRVQDGFDYLAVCNGWIASLLALICSVIANLVITDVETALIAIVVFLVLGAIAVRLCTLGSDGYHSRVHAIRMGYRIAPMALFFVKLAVDWVCTHP